MKKNIMFPLASAIILFACNSESSTDTNKDTLTTTTMSTDTASTASNAMQDRPADPGVVTFVNDAAVAGMMEIDLGNIAKGKTKNPRVMAFANMMISDHTAAANELKAEATSNGITVPSELPAEDKQHIETMKAMNGTAFDKHYMDMMVNGHKKVVDEFKAASKDLKNDAIKNFATRTLPVLEKHLDSAKAIFKKM